MTKFMLALLALLLVVACNAQTSGREKPLIKVASDKKALPVIAVSGSQIKINDTTVWLGDTLENWKKVLGGTPTCYSGLIVTCVWHSAGLSLGTDHLDKTRVTFMLLDLTIKPLELGERAPSWPQSSFAEPSNSMAFPSTPTQHFEIFFGRFRPLGSYDAEVAIAATPLQLSVMARTFI